MNAQIQASSRVVVKMVGFEKNTDSRNAEARLLGGLQANHLAVREGFEPSIGY
jgi:hypothetical protein